jgi:cbb3-type cytochrome c oxidase subunit III
MKREKLMKLPVVTAAVAVVLLALLSHSAIGVSLSAASVTPVPDGATVFGAKCALCHGKDGSGLPNWKAKGQPDFTSADWQNSHTDAQIVESIKNGKGKFMPPFKAKLSDDEVAAVTARVRAFGKKK